MRLTALLACLVLMSFATAGCFGGDGDKDSSPTTSSSSSTSSGSSMSSSATSSSTTTTAPGNQTNATNRAPEAGLTADPINGSAPLNVTFSVTASDPDNDQLTWTLQFGDGSQAEGNGTNGTLVHTYGESGNYTVDLVVEDGRGMNATAQATVIVAKGGDSAPAGHFQGTVQTRCATGIGTCSLAGNTADGAPVGHAGFGCASMRDGQPGGDCTWFELTADMEGKDFLVTSTGGDPDLAFTTECSGDSGSQTGIQETEAPEETGTVPAGSRCIVIWEFGTAPSTIIVDIQV